MADRAGLADTVRSSSLAQSKFPQFVQDLREIVGERNVISHPDDLLVYEYDGSH